MPEQRYQNLKPSLGPGEKGVVVIHPDPDSMASAWALKLLFKKHKSTADIAIYEPIKRIDNRTMVKLLRLPLVNYKDIKLENYTRLCLVDAQPNQFPEVSPEKWHIVIDHHPVYPECNCQFTDIRPELGATSTMMDQYLTQARVRITERIATALCYGIMTDTDNFQRNMTKEDAQAFSHLFPHVNYRLLQVIEQTEIPFKQLQYFDLALHRLEVEKRRAVIHIGATESPDIAVMLADFFIRVSGIQFVCVSCISGDKLYIIFRSRNMRKDAGKIASSHFNDIGSAGGHKAAARAEIPLDNLPDDVMLYSPDSIEAFIEKSLSKKPGRPPKASGENS